MKAKNLINDQLGASILAEVLVVLLVLGAVAFGAYRIYQDKYQAVACDSKDCFEKKFDKCEKAKYTFKSETEGAFYSEIYGPKDGGCSTLMRYLKYPQNPSWVGKDLVCTLDSSKSLDDALNSTLSRIVAGQNTSCKGPFLEVLQNLPNS
ncbi:MAG TPA: hypothetical protein VFK11_02365 [Candidatus Saccharimonadales bacterium]|nr:hypothetical protein [Candidatus Saccharimonadales bacterium]